MLIARTLWQLAFCLLLVSSVTAWTASTAAAALPSSILAPHVGSSLLSTDAAINPKASITFIKCDVYSIADAYAKDAASKNREALGIAQTAALNAFDVPRRAIKGLMGPLHNNPIVTSFKDAFTLREDTLRPYVNEVKTGADTARTAAAAAEQKLADLSRTLTDPNNVTPALTAIHNAYVALVPLWDAFRDASLAVADAARNNAVADLSASADPWTIHGLWPEGTGAAQLTDMSAAVEAELRTLPNMLTSWPNCVNRANPHGFWNHEWTTHGKDYLARAMSAAAYAEDTLSLTGKSAYCTAALQNLMSQPPPTSDQMMANRDDTVVINGVPAQVTISPKTDCIVSLLWRKEKIEPSGAATASGGARTVRAPVTSITLRNCAVSEALKMPKVSEGGPAAMRGAETSWNVLAFKPAVSRYTIKAQFNDVAFAAVKAAAATAWSLCGPAPKPAVKRVKGAPPPPSPERLAWQDAWTTYGAKSYGVRVVDYFLDGVRHRDKFEAVCRAAFMTFGKPGSGKNSQFWAKPPFPFTYKDDEFTATLTAGGDCTVAYLWTPGAFV